MEWIEGSLRCYVFRGGRLVVAVRCAGEESSVRAPGTFDAMRAEVYCEGDPVEARALELAVKDRRDSPGAAALGAIAPAVDDWILRTASAFLRGAAPQSAPLADPGRLVPASRLEDFAVKVDPAPDLGPLVLENRGLVGAITSYTDMRPARGAAERAVEWADRINQTEQSINRANGLWGSTRGVE